MKQKLENARLVKLNQFMHTVLYQLGIIYNMEINQSLAFNLSMMYVYVPPIGYEEIKEALKDRIVFITASLLVLAEPSFLLINPEYISAYISS